MVELVLTRFEPPLVPVHAVWPANQIVAGQDPIIPQLSCHAPEGRAPLSSKRFDSTRSSARVFATDSQRPLWVLAVSKPLREVAMWALFLGLDLLDPWPAVFAEVGSWKIVASLEDHRR